ncbi:hypothetical protein B0T36_15630 [Nocardia donostiensis]|nr:hypothetical protein B0T36_15630 [Nocardia donostiensis]
MGEQLRLDWKHRVAEMADTGSEVGIDLGLTTFAVLSNGQTIALPPPRWTALHEAIVYRDGSPRYRQVVTALLDAGADPSIRDGAGRIALDNAQRRGQTDIVTILRNHPNGGRR